MTTAVGVETRNMSVLLEEVVGAHAETARVPDVVVEPCEPHVVVVIVVLP